MRLKHKPSDFRVAESMAVDTCPEGPGTYHFVRLHQMGFTTFEAVATIAEYFAVPATDERYSGQKDEDAVTEQFVSFRHPVSMVELEQFNSRFDKEAVSDGVRRPRKPRSARNSSTTLRDYTFANNQQSVLTAWQNSGDRRCGSYRYVVGEMRYKESARPIAVQVQVRISDVREDATMP